MNDIFLTNFIEGLYFLDPISCVLNIIEKMSRGNVQYTYLCKTFLLVSVAWQLYSQSNIQ